MFHHLLYETLELEGRVGVTGHGSLDEMLCLTEA